MPIGLYLRMEGTMTPATRWFNASVGRKIDDDGAYGAQCMDLYADYQRNCLKVTVKGAPAAKDVWNNNSYNTSAFTKIANTPSFIPKRGDVCVWTNGTYGHIAVCTGEGNTNYFVSLDQNWFSPWNGTGAATYVSHNYTGVAGFLRPKQDVNYDQEAIDAANAAAKAAAEKAAADAKAKADALAKAEAIRVAAEQKKLADEQARLKAELEAKIEADRLAEEARLKAEKELEIIIKEVPVESKKFQLNKEDLLKIGKGALIALSGALGAYVLSVLNVIDAGVYTPLVVAGLSIVANALVKFSTGK
jgi:hypothetical protein